MTMTLSSLDGFSFLLSSFMVSMSVARSIGGAHVYVAWLYQLSLDFC